MYLGSKAKQVFGICTGKHLLRQDPEGQLGVLATSFPRSDHAKMGIDSGRFDRLRERFFVSFSSDPKILAFAHYFCMKTHETSNEMSSYCTRVLYECLTQDKSDMVANYLWIYQTLNSVFTGSADVGSVRNLKIITQLYLNHKVISNDANQLIDRSFVALVDFEIQTFFARMIRSSVITEAFQHSTMGDVLLQYVLNGDAVYRGLSSLEVSLLNAYLTYHSWPSSAELFEIRGLILNSSAIKNANQLFKLRLKLSSSAFEFIKRALDTTLTL
jgi:Anaphase-promoting complex sub unit 1 C-terminal domain